MIEKSAEIGDHGLSGAVLDPIALRELMPDEARGFRSRARSRTRTVLPHSKRRELRFPIPPPLENHGNYVISLGKLVKWLAAKVEAAGVDVFTAFPGRGRHRRRRVAGVLTGDKGSTSTASRRRTSSPAATSARKVTVFGEGPRGTLQKQLAPRLGLDARTTRRSTPRAQGGLGAPAGRFPHGHVVHTMGYPLDPTPSAAASSTGWRTTCCSSASSSGSTTAARPRPAPGAPEVQGASRARGAARGRQGGLLRREGDARGRLLRDAEALARRLPLRSATRPGS